MRTVLALLFVLFASCAPGGASLPVLDPGVVMQLRRDVDSIQASLAKGDISTDQAASETRAALLRAGVAEGDSIFPELGGGAGGLALILTILKLLKDRNGSGKKPQE